MFEHVERGKKKKVRINAANLHKIKRINEIEGPNTSLKTTQLDGEFRCQEHHKLIVPCMRTC